MSDQPTIVREGYRPTKVEKGYQPREPKPIPVPIPTGDPTPLGGYQPTSEGDNPPNPPGEE